MNQILSVINIIFGILIVTGYFLFECVFFGGFMFIIWNICDFSSIFNIPEITYFQMVGMLLLYKIIRFDSSKNIPKETAE